MSVDVKKKFVISLGQATAIELLKELLHRILRTKTPDMEAVEVPCRVVNRFSFSLNEFGKLVSKTYSYNIISILNDVCSGFGSNEITERIQQIQKEYEWVETRFHESKDFLTNFKKYSEREWFDYSTKYLIEAIERYSKCARPLDDLLLACGNPQTLKTALGKVSKYYVPMRETFNYLVNELYKLGRMTDYISIGQSKHDMLLPEIPSKENLMTLLGVTRKEGVIGQR